MDKNNRVVIVTGASSGIGASIAKLFSDRGDKVYGISRSGKCEVGTGVACDITDEVSVAEAINSIIQAEGRIDVLVNNAGVGVSGSVETTATDKLRKQMEVNFFGSVNMMRAVLPFMRAYSNGRIINTSSFASIVGIPFQAYYSASKAALDNLAFALRCEVAEYGIWVTNVLPGDTRTGFTDNREKQEDEVAGDYSRKMTRSIQQMEKDERQGMNPNAVANIVYKISRKCRPPVTRIVGAKYRIFGFLIKILPKRFANWVIKKMYVGD